MGFCRQPPSFSVQWIATFVFCLFLVICIFGQPGYNYFNKALVAFVFPTMMNNNHMYITKLSTLIKIKLTFYSGVWFKSQIYD